MGTALPFSNRYVFAKVMQDNPNLCKEVVERVLDIKIDRIEAIRVESESVSIANRSVRFDVFLQSDSAAFEVEMQTYEQRALPKRMRFYRSQLDRRMLGKSDDFDKLKPVYVIFICTSDPFDRGLPVYTFRSRCDEDQSVPFDNGAVDLVLNAQSNLELARPDIANLLQFVKTSIAAKNDPLTLKLATAMEDAFKDEEWVRSMSWLDWDIRDAKEQAAKEGRAEGRSQGIAEGQKDERSRQMRLVQCMEEQGCSADEILRMLKGDDRDSLYSRYGIA